MHCPGSSSSSFCTAVLLLGGGLALYLGFDELKDSWKSEEGVDAPADDDKAKIAELEKELEELKK